MELIKLEELQAGYKDRIVLASLTETIFQGEVVLLEGENGSGKTTLMQILNGLLFPTFGHYWFMEEEITPETVRQEGFAKWFHGQIGYLFQRSDTQLFNPSVREEVAYGLRQMELSEEEIDRRVTDSLNLLKIGELAERTPYHLSGGEQKKVAFASILAMNPPMYILDEPFNNLDAESRKLMLSLLFALKQKGKTMLISAHQEPGLEDLADRNLLLRMMKKR